MKTDVTKKKLTRRGMISTAVAAVPAASLMAAPPPGVKLPDVVISEANTKLTREPFGDLRIYFEGPTDQLKSMTAGSLRLKPGMSPHEPHRHPEEEFMVMTEGTGEISIEGRITRFGPGAMMYCAANKLHGIVNTGKTPLMFYFYKWQK